MSDGPTKTQRDEGRELGLTFPRGTTGAQAGQQIADARAAAAAAPITQEQPPSDVEKHRPDGPLGDAPDEGDRPDDGETREISRKIEHVTERGDWTDPFSGLVTFHGNDRNPQSGAIRRGDTAVLVVPKD